MLHRRNLLRSGLWGMATIAVAGFVWVRLVDRRGESPVLDVLGQGDYVLATTDGGTFTQASLTGVPSAVFFGFTHCPEVCPTTLGEIGVWQDDLAKAGLDPLRVFFVTVDPERDTSDVLGDYVSWVPGVTGVTGSREEVDKAIAAFRIYAQKVPLDDGDYTMDHSAMVLLFDENGSFFEPISYQEDIDRAMSQIRRLLGAEPTA